MLCIVMQHSKKSTACPTELEGLVYILGLHLARMPRAAQYMWCEGDPNAPLRPLSHEVDSD